MSMSITYLRHIKQVPKITHFIAPCATKSSYITNNIHNIFPKCIQCNTLIIFVMITAFSAVIRLQTGVPQFILNIHIKNVLAPSRYTLLYNVYMHKTTNNYSDAIFMFVYKR